MDLFTFIQETEGLENAVNFAARYGLLPNKNNHQCIRCGREEGLRWTKNCKVISLPYMFVCAQRECRATVSVGRNTIFDRLRFPLSSALRLIYFWLLKFSVRDSANQLQLPENTVSEWYQIFQEVCAYVIINYTEAIGGPGHTVEICEYHLQTSEEGYDVWIFTGIDRHTGHNFAIHVEELDCEVLWPVIKNYILPGSVVVTSMHQEFTKMENKLDCRSLSFVHPSKSPKTKEHYDLDGMWNALNQYLEKELPIFYNKACKELYAYQFLYFNRDGFCNRPASELITLFMSDVKLAYPGYVKANRNYNSTKRST